jgi:ADP-heptose:LPS heptosyltransferase
MGANVLIISGPADGDNSHRVAGLMKKRPIIVENLSVLELASVLERCDIFVGNDSGVTHLSWAVGTKTLAIFGPTDPLVWGPRGEGTVICRRGESLDLVRSEDVVAELEEL